MSGRGRNGGGRSNYHGGHGRSGQQGRGHGGRGENNYYQHNQGRNNGASVKETKPERFMLHKNDGTGRVNDWFTQQENFASEHMSKTTVSWIVNLQDPGGTPEVEEPELPLKRHFTEKTGERRLEDGTLEEIVEFDEEMYKHAMFEYDIRYKEHRKDTRQIKEDLKALYSSMKVYLSKDARREIDTRKGPLIWVNEDAEELAEAIKEIFLAPTEGAIGNQMDMWEQRGKFAAIKQRPGQSASEFLEFYKQKLEALKIMELSTGQKTEAQLALEWSDKETASNFVSKLLMLQAGDWWRGMKFRNNELPETLEDAFIEACNAEKEYNQVSRSQRQLERMNTFHGSPRDGGRGRHNERDYGRAVRTGNGDSEDVWLDANGRPTCHDYHKGHCDWKERTGKDCGFSHYPQVSIRPKGGNQRNQERAAGKVETHQQIERAAQQVQWKDNTGTTAAAPKVDPIPPPTGNKSGGRKENNN